MLDKEKSLFNKERTQTFDRIISQIEKRLQKFSPQILFKLDNFSTEHLSESTEKEIWTLFLNGVQHLKNGGPNDQPGTFTEALTRTSLRACSLASTLGIPRPKFQQLCFPIDYTKGNEAAIFFCQQLVEAANNDLKESKKIIQKKLQDEKPAHAFEHLPEEELQKIDDIKRQMAFSFSTASDLYEKICAEFKSILLEDVPPQIKKKNAPRREP